MRFYTDCDIVNICIFVGKEYLLEKKVKLCPFILNEEEWL